MGRVNKFTAGVFTDIVGDQKSIPAYNHFQSIQEGLETASPELNRYLDIYKKSIDKNKLTFESLARLEDLIMQLRTRENLNIKDIRLNIVREYIYARVPFHRKDKETKDIRVIVGQTKSRRKDLKKLLGNEKFLTIAKEKLTLAMDDLINESIALVNAK